MLDRLCRMCMIHRNNFSSCIRVSRTLDTGTVICGVSRHLYLAYIQPFNVGRTFLSRLSAVPSNFHIPHEKHIRCISSDSHVKEEKVEDYYTMSYIYVRTSRERWHEAPEGVQFDAGFVESTPNTSGSKVPVIVGLPSCVGSHKDLMNVLLVFVKYGCRVIIPNMPSTRYCFCRSRSETTIFTNSPDEKAEFVKDFLAEVDVKKVQLLVTDSDSVYTGIMLCSDDSQMFQSLAMINPTGLKHTRFMRPVLMYRNINVMWDEVFYMQPVVWIMLFIFKMFTSKRHLTVNEFITLSKTISWLDFAEIVAEIEIFSSSAVPCMALYREDCKELDRESTEKMLGMLGVPQTSISVYSEQDQILTKGTKNGNKWAVLFKGDVGDIKVTRLKTIRTKLLEFYKGSLNNRQ